MKNNLLPRPWYLTIGSFWDWANEHDQLDDWLDQSGCYERVPFHQVLINRSHRHTTMISILKFSSWPRDQTAEQFGLDLLSRLRIDTDLEKIQEGFLGFKMRPYAVNCYSSGTAIQFDSVDSRVKEFRQLVRNIVQPFVTRIEQESLRDGFDVKGLLGEARNFGNHLHASFARSPLVEPNQLLWSKEIEDSILQSFATTRLMVSDQSMANPATVNENASVDFNTDV